MIEAIGRPNLLPDGFPPTGLVKAPVTIALDSPDDVPGHPHDRNVLCRGRGVRELVFGRPGGIRSGVIPRLSGMSSGGCLYYCRRRLILNGVVM